MRGRGIDEDPHLPAKSLSCFCYLFTICMKDPVELWCVSTCSVSLYLLWGPQRAMHDIFPLQYYLFAG